MDKRRDNGSKRHILWLIGGGLCLLLSGCVERGFTGFTVDEQPVVLADSALSQQVSVSSKREGFGSPLRVGVQLHNQRATPLALEYRLYWYDAQGIELDHDATPWQPVTLKAQQKWSTHITASEPQAQAYRLHVRPLRQPVEPVEMVTASEMP